MQDTAYYLQRARFLIDQNRWLLAEPELRQALALAPDNIEAMSLLGMCVAFNSDLAAGIDLLQQAISTDPNRDLSYWRLYQIHRLSNNWIAAKQAIDTAIEIDPENPSYYGSLALIFYHVGTLCTHSDATVRTIVPNLGLAAEDIDFAAPVKNIARSLLQLANKMAETGLALYPRDRLCLEYKTCALIDLGEYATAAAMCRIWLSITPNSAVAHAVVGDLYYRQHRLDDAIASFQTALQIQPGYDFVKAKMLQILRLQHPLTQTVVKPYHRTIDRACSWLKLSIDRSLLAIFQVYILILTLIWFDPISIGIASIFWLPSLLDFIINDLVNRQLMRDCDRRYLFSAQAKRKIGRDRQIVIVCIILFIARGFIPWHLKISIWAIIPLFFTFAAFRRTSIRESATRAERELSFDARDRSAS